jgi:hypothetical protein
MTKHQYSLTIFEQGWMVCAPIRPFDQSHGVYYTTLEGSSKKAKDPLLGMVFQTRIKFMQHNRHICQAHTLAAQTRKHNQAAGSKWVMNGPFIDQVLL